MGLAWVFVLFAALETGNDYLCDQALERITGLDCAIGPSVLTQCDFNEQLKELKSAKRVRRYLILLIFLFSISCKSEGSAQIETFAAIQCFRLASARVHNLHIVRDFGLLVDLSELDCWKAITHNADCLDPV